MVYYAPIGSEEEHEFAQGPCLHKDESPRHRQERGDQPRRGNSQLRVCLTSEERDLRGRVSLALTPDNSRSVVKPTSTLLQRQRA